MDSLLRKYFKHELSCEPTDEKFSKVITRKHVFGKKIISGTLALLLTLPNASVLNALDNSKTNSKKSKTETVAEQQQFHKMSTGTKCAIGAVSFGTALGCAYYNRRKIARYARYVRRQRNIKLMRDWIQKAIDNKIDINQKHKYGYTPLHYAAWLGDSNEINRLIDQGASLTKQNDLGDTAAMTYIGNGHNDLETFKKLVNDHDLDIINIENCYYLTVLTLAEHNKNHNGSMDLIVNYLLNDVPGIDVKTTSTHGDSALRIGEAFHTLSSGQEQRPEDLENPSSDEESDQEEIDATTSKQPKSDFELFIDAMHNSDRIKELCENNHNIDASRDGEVSPEEAYTPLVYAVESVADKHSSLIYLIRTLLANGATVTMRCLCAAINWGRHDILALLLENDKNLDKHLNMSVNSGNLGYTSLLNYCVINGSSELCKLLIAYGAKSGDSEQSVLYTAAITRPKDYYIFVRDMLEYYGKHQEYRPSARDMTKVCVALRSDCPNRENVLSLVEKKFKEWYSADYDGYIASHDVSEQNPQTI